ncbi:MAG: hypothetical protein BWY83_03372 [bacterium ADurb.Bin478]|nr:MAG: hypothetical protein BWY83_03372 [bacterium ADurb.Bin478]
MFPDRFQRAGNFFPQGCEKAEVASAGNTVIQGLFVDARQTQQSALIDPEDVPAAAMGVQQFVGNRGIKNHLIGAAVKRFARSHDPVADKIQLPSSGVCGVAGFKRLWIVQASAGGEIIDGRRQRGPSSQIQFMVVNQQVSLYAGACSRFTQQVAGRVVLPDHSSGLCVQGIDIDAIIVEDAGGDISYAVFDQHAAGPWPGRQ